MNKKKYAFLAIGIIFGIIVFLGSAYALFVFFRAGTTNSGFTTADIDLAFANGENTINLDAAFPTVDSVGLKMDGYDFSISGYSTDASSLAEYKISLVNADVPEGYLEENRLPSNAIRVYLEDEDHNQLYLGSPVAGDVFFTNVIYGGDKNNQITHRYNLKFWVSDKVLVSDTATLSDYPDHVVLYSTEEYGNTFASFQVNVDGININSANAPELPDGMIPVKYDEANKVWVKADINNSNYDWYDYVDKKWANAVMVKETSTNNTSMIGASTSEVSTTCTGTDNYCTREDYLDASNGVTIKDNDILAFYVWIPRYKYQLFNVGGSGASYTNGVCTANCPSEIQIDFERGTATTGKGTTNGTWLTHPAFTLGTQELKGIWVGKFETSPSTLDATSTTCKNGINVANCDKEGIMPAIVPNAYSLRYQKVSNQYKTALNFTNGTNYLNSITNTDSHMMKNTEWGAVTYLSHSKYGTCENGVCKEVAINDSAYITGRSNGSMSIPTSSQGKYKYNNIGVYENVYSVTSPTNVNYSVNLNTVVDEVEPGEEDPLEWTLQDGYYMSKSLASSDNTSRPTMTISFTLDTTGVLSFDYGVSSRSYSNGIYYTIKKDSNAATGTFSSNGLSGDYYGTTASTIIYKHKTETLTAGTYLVSFIYFKSSSTVGLEKGFVKNIKVEKGTVTTNNVLLNGVSGTNSSTTGNIYGIYDMSGGSWEYVMGVLGDTNTPSKPRSGYTDASNSGFTGMLLSGDIFAGDPEVLFPNSKYYNMYTTSRSSRILGDALEETKSWYRDYSTWVSTTYPWFRRGGGIGNGSNAGLFNFYYRTGAADLNYGFRSVLAHY